MMSVQIKKADGSIEIFKVEKLRRSLRRAGATPEEVNEIVSEINPILTDGTNTQFIYRHAFALLRRSKPTAAARYSLRRALFNLGPTGFPFEKFLSRLFSTQGYTTDTGIVIEGNCVSHEIDLTAYKPDHCFVAEAKFHGRPGNKSDLQVAMYSYARFLDLKGKAVSAEAGCTIDEFWLITNTKFTTTAVQYADCVGIKLLGWTHPKKNNLHDYIQRAGVYPITVLQNLSVSQIESLVAREVILCKDLLERSHVLRHLHLSPRKQEAVLQEARDICLTVSNN